MMKTKCPECGFRNPENQRGCNYCGLIYNPPIRLVTKGRKGEQ